MRDHGFLETAQFHESLVTIWGQQLLEDALSQAGFSSPGSWILEALGGLAGSVGSGCSLHPIWSTGQCITRTRTWASGPLSADHILGHDGK